MVEFQNNLEWRWNGLNSKGIDNFLKIIDKVPLTIRRSLPTKEEEKDCRVEVRFYGTQADFIISPAKGRLEYLFDEFKGQGFENSAFSISYNSIGTQMSPLNTHEVLKIGDAGNRFYFLTKPLYPQD